MVDLFDRSVQTFGACAAFTGSNTTLSFSGLYALSRAFAAYLQQVQGITQQDCVAVMLPNLLQFPIALFGAMRTGARITNVNSLYTPGELEHQLSDAGAKAIVVHADAMPVLAKVLGKTAIDTVSIARPDDVTSTPKG